LYYAMLYELIHSYDTYVQSEMYPMALVSVCNNNNNN